MWWPITHNCIRDQVKLIISRCRMALSHPDDDTDGHVGFVYEIVTKCNDHHVWSTEFSTNGQMV